MQIIERENNFIIYQFRKLTHSLERAHAAIYNYIYCISRLLKTLVPPPKKKKEKEKKTLAPPLT